MVSTWRAMNPGKARRFDRMNKDDIGELTSGLDQRHTGKEFYCDLCGFGHTITGGSWNRNDGEFICHDCYINARTVKTMEAVGLAH